VVHEFVLELVKLLRQDLIRREQITKANEGTDDVPAFSIIGLSSADCVAILTHAEYQLSSLHEVLG